MTRSTLKPTASRSVRPMVVATTLLVLCDICSLQPVTGFSEGLKAVARVGEDTFYASHHDGNAIIRFTNRSTAIVAGSDRGAAGDVDGVGLSARLHGPQGMAWDGGNNIYFVDTFNGKLKRLVLENHSVTTIASLGPASPVKSNAQGSNGGWFPIAVALKLSTPGGADSPPVAYVSNKYNKSISRVDLQVGGAVENIPTSCKWFKPHGISVSGDRLLVADDSFGVHMIDLGGSAPHSCTTLSGTAAKWFSFRDVSWVNSSTALLMERFGPGTVYLWNVDTNVTARIYGGGGSSKNDRNKCWRDAVTGIMPDGSPGGLWKAMSLSYDPQRWPNSILLADTGANFLRRLAVNPGNLALPATATTVPCFNTTHRFTRSNPGTIEHAICGLGDGPFPRQLPPCAPCMNASEGTWCKCPDYHSASWCVNPPPTSQLTPPPSPPISTQSSILVPRSLELQQHETALNLTKKLQSCSKLLGSRTAAARELASIAVARLFMNYSHVDASASAQRVIAKSAARFEGRATPNSSDFAAASLVPAMEMNDTVTFLETALDECHAVRNRSLRRPEARLPIGPLRVDPENGFLKDANRRTTFIYGYNQQPDLTDSTQASVARALAMGFTDIFVEPALVLDGKACCAVKQRAINAVVHKLAESEAAGQTVQIFIGNGNANGGNISNQAFPAWAEERFPNITSGRGKTHFYSYDIDHPGTRMIWQFVLDGLVHHVANFSHVLGWSLANEPGFRSSDSEFAFANWSKFLKTRYDGELSRLQTSWQLPRTLKSFEDRLLFAGIDTHSSTFLYIPNLTRNFTLGLTHCCPHPRPQRHPCPHPRLSIVVRRHGHPHFLRSTAAGLGGLQQGSRHLVLLMAVWRNKKSISGQ